MDCHEDFEPDTLPRWVTIPLGLLFTPFTLLCVIGSATLLIYPNKPLSILSVSLGSIFLGGSLWVFYLSLRLLFVNPKSRTKFLSPFGLKVISLVFAAIPIISLATGTFWEKPIVYSFMTVSYIGIVSYCWVLANHRRQNA